MKKCSPVLLFDGVCNLCNSLVRFIIRHDNSEIVKFAALQSEAGKQFLTEKGLPEGFRDSVILVEGTKYYYRSTAVLHLFKLMGGPWRFLYGFIIIPAFIRDLFYNIIGKCRYRVFGNSKFCILPPDEIVNRFIM
jgi:predicted DCC family thiol-disulfide oxidoreductase YuxK